MAVHLTLSLAQLKAYAQEHASEWFDLNSCRACLACKVSGQNMVGHHTFAGDSGPYHDVDERFAQCTGFVEPTNRPNLNSDNNGPKFFRGEELIKAIARLEDDDHPLDVAQFLNEVAAEDVSV